MIQIIHLSDFHLNPKNLSDWNTYIKKSFIDKLKNLSLDLPNLYIVCTGDLVDKGGKDFITIQEAFKQFKSEVIDFICTELSIPIDRFLIVPGNHDIVRENDSDRIELGSKEFFKTYNNILSSQKDILDKGEREGVKRMIPYKEFENTLYKGFNKYSSFLGTAFKYESKESVGIACLNSAWRAFDDNDKNYIILGEEQLNRCSDFIENCNIKIALMHHPLDWFSLEKNIITSHINKDYDLLFVGHVHESSTILQTGFTGTLFTDIASSYTSDIRSDSKAFSNGFSLINYSKSHSFIDVDCSFYKYNHKNKEYVINTDLGNEGKFVQKQKIQELSSNQVMIEKALVNIRNIFYPIMDEHVIAQKANISLSIKDAFILPPITLQDNNDDQITLNDISKSRQNQFFFGSYEIGKTTLLYRIVREFVDEYIQLQKIPVYFDVNQIGNKDIITIIKQFLNVSTDDTRKLINDNLIIIIADNLDYTELNEDKINKISKFLRDNPEIQIIASSNNELIGVPPQNYIKKTKISFSHFFIRPLKSFHIKSIMNKWIPEEDSLKKDARLDKMITNFNSYALPSTAMSVSLFLWSTENADRKPINQAILLDIYIEIVLEKLAKENIYRATFNYKNKAMLLAYIAEQMLFSTKTNYSIDYVDYIKHIRDYLKLVSQKYDVSRIAEYFIERKIFTKISDNQIKFTHSCFFHFFLAKRMEFNPKFKDSVLDTKTFYMYPKEIDYYTGLVLNDEVTLKFVFQEFENSFNGLQNMLDNFDVDRFFTYILKSEEEHNPIVKSIQVDNVKEKRPSKEKVMQFYDNKLDKIPKDLILKKIDDFNLEKLIIIMSTVLRNSEGVENSMLKNTIYNSVIRNTVAWSVLYKESIVQYIIENKKMPSFIPKEENLVRFLRFLPLSIQGGVNNFLGTYKLTPIILNKINHDLNNKKCSDIEVFMSVSLYWDSLGTDYPKYISKLIRRLSNNVVQDYVLIKLLDSYYRKTKPNTREEDKYLDMLTELKLKHEKLPKKLTESVRRSIKNAKEKFINQNKLKPFGLE